jgi:hypothetical protein
MPPQTGDRICTWHRCHAAADSGPAGISAVATLATGLPASKNGRVIRQQVLVVARYQGKRR